MKLLSRKLLVGNCFGTPTSQPRFTKMWVHIPKGKSTTVEVKPIGHRKMLEFRWPGRLSVGSLDTIIKVA